MPGAAATLASVATECPKSGSAVLEIREAEPVGPDLELVALGNPLGGSPSPDVDAMMEYRVKVM